MANERHESTVHRTEDAADDFEALSKEHRPGLLREFWDFLAYNKKWWLLPIVITILLVGLLALVGGGAAAPFVYTLF